MHKHVKASGAGARHSEVVSEGTLGTRACLGVRLRDLLQGPFRWALLSNYMIDTRWLLSAVPALLRPDLRLLIVHGERDARYASGPPWGILCRASKPFFFFFSLSPCG